MSNTQLKTDNPLGSIANPLQDQMVKTGIVNKSYDDHNNSPYAEKLAVRIGFEWQMKKKIKAKQKTSNK